MDSKEFTSQLISKFPHQYDISEESNNFFLLEVYLKELLEVNQVLYNLTEALDIRKAKGSYLERFGSIFGLLRETNETDDNYRIRILAEMISSSKNATFEVIYNTLDLIVGDLGNNLYIYDEGIYPDYIQEVTNKHYVYEVFQGSYGSTTIEANMVKKGGVMYFVFNKSLPLSKKESIKKILLDIKACGVKIFVEFKYKLQLSGFACGLTRVGTNIQLDILNTLFDGISQKKTSETNITQTGNIGLEGVR